MSNLTRALTLALLAMLVSTGTANASTPRERALARQVTALKTQLAHRTTERNTARGQLTTTRAQLTQTTTDLTAEKSNSAALQTTLANSSATLATCQRGAMPAVSTMSPEAMWTMLFPAIETAYQHEKTVNALRGYDQPTPPYTLSTFFDHAFDASFSATGQLQSADFNIYINGPAS